MQNNKPQTQPQQSQVVESPNSGAYNPGPIKDNDNDFPNAELWAVQSSAYDLASEEFPEGPYGAAHNETRLGKVSDWKPGQAFIGRYRDTNMITSDRQAATDEPDFKEPLGSIEGQN
ncbi:hypothetical protein [Alicyclobacillus dauci]|uniref:Uncharacterized protein n=1 Tax=Alicyclobacillus dauci TaxID=1475485 RepID=A0ABY6Z7Z8_9BACL|nr:hypothetical protein [Alicyclobacillus dauci]WAH38919.1 hypothetical protein NZD86_10770 [Alicyclobacillus dauci]